MRIDVDELGYSYGDREILNKISLNLESGKFTGIIGPNGSGKSTLLKCIYRVLTPNYGDIRFDDVSLKDISVKTSAKSVAVMAQHSFYNFDFKVFDVVMMGRAPHKRLLERDNAYDYEIVREALMKVNMTEFAEREFSTLSGGEQQRVILARAIAQQTECLILDEPTNHLDITYQLELMNILKKQKMTIFAAMHDLNIAAAFCDYIFVMKDGNIKAYGTPQQVLTPQLLKDVYNVCAEQAYDSKGNMHILFAE